MTPLFRSLATLTTSIPNIAYKHCARPLHCIAFVLLSQLAYIVGLARVATCKGESACTYALHSKYVSHPCSDYGTVMLSLIVAMETQSGSCIA